MQGCVGHEFEDTVESRFLVSFWGGGDRSSVPHNSVCEFIHLVVSPSL